MTDFKQRLRIGRTVSLVNADHACAGLVQFVGGLGIDAVMLDCEQGNPSFVDVEDMTRAARLAGVASIVRIPSPEPWTIERYVMRGIDGVVVPRLDTAVQVAKAVADIRYASPRDFARLTVIVQVESASALEELDGFLAVPEVDCFFIGAVDLAKSMGFAGDYSQPEVMDAMDKTIRRIRAQGRSVGFLVKEDDVQVWQAKGVTMLYAHVNDFLRLGARQWRRLSGIEPA
ncbi:HpcH/HpaI aldolase family protein [Variovorax guangxiensis]|uniref:2,4-dihydroxyhept-2-ene-1,7-dioic acid aldolase n=1 Tax=Variovorax guangxiensis TaxID=1775474 RepID=A0A502DHD1_9BURK|nr:aldolase/citrate lyase family protein [Variovorax guangxiensis]TPG23506.1 2,4-dihydroxyhept-2-ene-1,7-dioic acid aldolase [Variovorax guangxiensis]TPG24035.1 2,4-dihydroxyhept-2-ene-1,7-dioic acid aldolase [Variovorax ginsengisoli]